MKTFVAPLELKFITDAEPGEFEGYGAVFGNVDTQMDVIAPGAFKASLERHMASDTLPAMHVEHDWAFGGDPLPAGVWTELAEDGQGLRAKGRLSALDSDYGKRVHGLMRDGALKGLSIAYTVPEGGSERAKGRDARRLLKRVDLHSLDIVKFPSNPLARVSSVKTIMAQVDRESATRSIAAAIMVHRSSTAGGDSPNADERATLLNHLQDAHECLTGQRWPAGMKTTPQSVREFQDALREIGFSGSQAARIAERGYKTSHPRDEGEQAISRETKSALAVLSGFSLPTF